MIWWVVVSLSALGVDPLAVEPEDLGRRHDGERIVLEDMVSSVLGSGEERQFRLRRCANVVFRIGEKGPRTLSGNVRVVGTVRSGNGQVLVDVESISPIPTDMEQFASRARSISRDDFTGWYELSGWARRRAQLYMDDGMRAKAVEAYEQGMKLERRLAENDSEKLRALGDRVKEQNLVRNIDFVELRHAILWAEYRRMDDERSGVKSLEMFADRVATELDPGRSELPPAADSSLAARYEGNPVDAYRLAEGLQRRQLVRYWEAKLRKAAWESRIRSGESDGYEAWEWGAEHLSDYPDIGRAWLREAVGGDVQRLKELSRREVELLASRIRTGLGEEARANEALKQWLELREGSMRDAESREEATANRKGVRPRPKDAKARLELAELWLGWFSRDSAAEQKAAKLLVESLDIEPTYEAAATVLRSRGFVRGPEGKWLAPEEARATLSREAAKSVSEGMERDAVLKILGEPDSRMRFITGPRLVEEHWQYRNDRETLYVILVAREGKAGTVASVRKATSSSN